MEIERLAIIELLFNLSYKKRRHYKLLQEPGGWVSVHDDKSNTINISQSKRQYLSDLLRAASPIQGKVIKLRSDNLYC